ncbi:MAG: hypothetical protein M0Z40_12540 [Actinomycetota bacterium]|nr:hypothetical protein [Actinomycetota bacterium]
MLVVARQSCCCRTALRPLDESLDELLDMPLDRVEDDLEEREPSHTPRVTTRLDLLGTMMSAMASTAATVRAALSARDATMLPPSWSHSMKGAGEPKGTDTSAHLAAPDSSISSGRSRRAPTPSGRPRRAGVLPPWRPGLVQ